MNVTTCFKNLTVGALVLAFTTFASAQSSGPTSPNAPQPPVDWESALAEYSQLLQIQTDTTTWAIRSKPTPQMRKERARWVAGQHRYLAARYEASIVAEILESKDYDKVVPATLALIAKYPDQTAVHDTALAVVLKLLITPEAPEEVRISAFKQISPAFKGRSMFLERAAQHLNKIKIKPLDRWALISAAAQQCGDYPYTAIVLWAALREAAPDLGEKRFAEECRKFVAAYKDSWSTRNAMDTALSIAAKNGDKTAADDLAHRRDQYTIWNKSLADAFAQARKDIAAGNGIAAAAALDQVCAQVPAPIAESGWQALLKAHLLQDIPTEQSVPVMKVLLERAPDGVVIDDAAGVLKSMRTDRGIGILHAMLAARHAYDRERSANIVQQSIRATVDDDAAIRLALYRGAAKAAQTMGAPDRQVQYLIAIGELAWDVSPEEAKQALAQAASHYPEITPAAEAGWLLALLEGKNGITQGPLPRARNAADSTPVRPDVALPAGPTVSSSTVAGPTGIALAPQNTKANFLLGMTPAASSGQETAAQALDSNPADGWMPQKLPASLIVPLKSESTVDRLRIVTGGSTYYTVSLLDRQGQTLARYERDWAFWDYYRRADYWPTPDTTLNILPTAGVCFVRLDVYDANDDAARVVSLEAYGPAFHAQGEHLAAPVALGAGDHSVNVSWKAEEPAQTVTYTPVGEWMRGYPIMRWGKFWGRRTRLSANGGNVTMGFFGTNAALTVRDAGGIQWQLDGSTPALVSNTEKKPTDYLLSENMAPGFHMVRLRNTALVTEGEGMGPAGAELIGLKVNGVSRASVGIRFGSKSGKWGRWQAVTGVDGQASVAIPLEVNGMKPEQAQVGVFFDSREVKGAVSATVSDLKSTPAAARVTGDPAKVLTMASSAIPGVTEDTAMVLDLLKRRMVVVVYPKLGTEAEYQAARELAEKAGVYLISDDIGLNQSPALTLSVGTPHRHRYIRQFLALDSLWNRPEFFAKNDGYVLETHDVMTNVRYLAATGDTPEAAVLAAKRLTARLDARKASPAAPRLFASNTLDIIFSWQIRPEAPPLKELSVRMASGERRSTQFGLAADWAQQKVVITASDLVSDAGDKLSAPVVQPVANYEWEPFFGLVRIPNALVAADPFDMPVNTARGVWLTAQTAAQTKPGIYRGTVTVNADGRVTTVPMAVSVDPFKVAPQTQASTYTFFYMPYWFHKGTAAYDKALASGAADEAAVGATHVGITNVYDWTCERATAPAMAVVAAPNETPETLKWKGYGEGAKGVPAGQALFISFPQAITVREFFANVRGLPKTAVTIACWDGGQWRALSTQDVRMEKMPTVMPAAVDQTRPVQFFRLTGGEGATFSVERVGAFTDLKRTSPITYNFDAIDKQMDVFDLEYAKLGLKPSYIVQTSKRDMIAALDVYGVSHPYSAGITAIYCTQLKAHLEKSGRAERTLIKVADEPADLAAWAAWAAEVKKGGMKAMTCHSARFPEIDAAIGIMNPWVPHYQGDVRNVFFTRRKEAGDKVWWYTYGPPNSRLTGQPAENLAFWWLTQKWNFDGAMHYASMHPSETIFPTPFRYDAGQDHRVMYAPDGSVVRSPRRQLEEEGINDMRVIEYIRAQTAKFAVKDPAGAKTISDDLAKTLDAVVPYKYGYSVDPAAWLAARAKLYDMAVLLSKP
jgi:hypothetical protein